MKITEHLKNAKSTIFSFELLPPLKGEGIQTTFDAIDRLLEFEPRFINVTYHREEYVYKELNNGLLEKISIRKRPGTLGLCAAIMNKYNIDAIPHMTCGGFSKEENENELIDLNFLGIENILVVRGDPIKSELTFTPNPNGHKYSTDLLQQITNMNNGIYLDKDIENPTKTNFCAGVAGYPEKHIESPNMKTDLSYLKMKVDLGAEFVMTQMFFDNQKYFDFVKSCRDMGINIPIIPGIKTLTQKAQLVKLPKMFNIDIPDELADEILKCKTDKEVKQVGLEWTIKQSKELIKFGVPCLHYYTMGKTKLTREIAKQVF